MRDLHFGCSLRFATDEEQEDSEDVLLRLLSVNALLNKQHLRREPETPCLYDSGVVYTKPDQCDDRPPIKPGDLKTLLKLLRKMGADEETALMIVRILKGIEIFLDIPALYKRGKGDCNELVPARLAELWRGGCFASPYLTKMPNEHGGISYHALVLHPDGSSEDPSLILGMGGTEAAAERREEIAKNVERHMNYLAMGDQLVSQGAPLALVGEQIDRMGFLPRSGVFKSPYPPDEMAARRREFVGRARIDARLRRAA